MQRVPTSIYLNELIDEMTQLSEAPIECRNARILLSREISKVFEEMNKSGVMDKLKYGPVAHKNGYSPLFQSQDARSYPYSPSSPFPAGSSYFSPSSASFHLSENPFVTPMKNGKMRSPEQDLGDWTPENTPSDEAQFVLQTKIYIPKPPAKIKGRRVKCNYVGRILGPSGTSARMIESEYNVTLLIRGAGSMKNGGAEASLKGKKKYEHLDEQLHVLLIARHNDKQKCEEILDKAAEKIESLLTPVHDEYKKDQLVRYALMNGTYEERRRDIKRQSFGNWKSNTWTPN